MLNSRTLIVLTAIAASVSVQVLAQQSAPAPTAPASAPSSAPSSAPAATPAAPSAAPATAPAGLVATTNNPNLSVATVKLENGQRTSKIVGLSVYVDGADKIGTVDDLIMTSDNKVTVAVISMGGVLGVGSKLVAVPFEQLKLGADKAELPGVTKDALGAMPTFIY